MKKIKIKNLKSHPLPIIENAKASRDLQINFNQAEDALTIPTESRHDYECGSATQSGRSLLPESGADAPTVLSAVYTDSTPAKNRQADVPQYGRSMIEMLGVLAIIGVLSVGGIAGYSKAMTKYRVNKAIEQITLIAGNVRTFFGRQRNYIGVYCSGAYCNATDGCYGDSGNSNVTPTNTLSGCPILKKAKILPDEMLTVNADGKITAITNSFGDWVSLWTANKAKLGDWQAFVIIYQIRNNMEACIELVTHDWTNAGVKAIHTHGSGGTMYLKTPVDIAIAPDFCILAQKNAYEQTISFNFDIDLSSSLWSSTTWSN